MYKGGDRYYVLYSQYYRELRYIGAALLNLAPLYIRGSYNHPTSVGGAQTQ